MNKKVFFTILISIITIFILFVATLDEKLKIEANILYNVYLNGSSIGVIDDKERLYDLIDKNQTSIKNEYNVDNVYPPTDLKIIKTNTYNDKTDNILDVYNKVEENDDFTVKGYTITVSGEENNYVINVLDKEIFYNAAKRFAKAFLAEDEYEKYINNIQDEIVDTGRIIDSMQFKENIKIREHYISVNEKIYTDENELVQFLLFGANPDTKTYTVKLGDTIPTVAENNKLNSKEFLIANPEFKSESDLLRVGEKVDVTLIVPQLTFIYSLTEIKDSQAYFQTEVVKDSKLPTSYNKVTTPGQIGIERNKEIYSVENGIRSQETTVIHLSTIREVRNQIITVGTRNDSPRPIENPVILNGIWGWPTNQGYVITTYYEYSRGKLHTGLDISGAGNFGSPIYAAADGTVEYTYSGCPSRGKGINDHCGNNLGNQVYINHNNGYTTRYGHMHQNIEVKAGQKVSKGQKIGYMGNSGSSTGVHVHYEVTYNGAYMNPLRLYR